MYRFYFSLSKLSCFLPLFILINVRPVQGTFSVVAVDMDTKQIGSTGATCLFRSNLTVSVIASVVPNKGAINVQGWYDESAKEQAARWFRAGENATSMTRKLPRDTQREYESDSSTVDAHQYLVVDIHRGIATHSGPSVDPVVEIVKGNASSRFFFVIGGNFLNSTLSVTQRMKNAFENAPRSSSLADRLMAALEGANIAGADARCQYGGRAATTAHLKVALPTDTEDRLWIDLGVPTINGDPIVALRSLYENWKGTHRNHGH